MIRSPYVDLFELELARGRARADLEALSAAVAPFERAMRQMGVSFREASRRMVEAFAAIERAGVTIRPPR